MLFFKKKPVPPRHELLKPELLKPKQLKIGYRVLEVHLRLNPRARRMIAKVNPATAERSFTAPSRRGLAEPLAPRGGASLGESLTTVVGGGGWKYIERIDGMGGAVAAIEAGFMQDEIEQASYTYTKAIDAGDKVIVGVNKFQTEQLEPPEVFPIDPAMPAAQVARVRHTPATPNPPGADASHARTRRPARRSFHRRPWRPDTATRRALGSESVRLDRVEAPLRALRVRGLRLELLHERVYVPGNRDVRVVVRVDLAVPGDPLAARPRGAPPARACPGPGHRIRPHVEPDARARARHPDAPRPRGHRRHGVLGDARRTARVHHRG